MARGVVGVGVAALAAVAKKLPELPPTARVLTFCYDTGERYLSVPGLFELPADAPTAATPAPPARA